MHVVSLMYSIMLNECKHYMDKVFTINLYVFREMENVNGHVKFQNHYGNVHVHLSGNCKTWRSDSVSGDGGWLSADVFVDIFEQQWHSNLKITNLFVPVCYISNDYLYLTAELRFRSLRLH